MSTINAKSHIRIGFLNSGTHLFFSVKKICISLSKVKKLILLKVSKVNAFSNKLLNNSTINNSYLKIICIIYISYLNKILL